MNPIYLYWKDFELCYAGKTLANYSGINEEALPIKYFQELWSEISLE